MEQEYITITSTEIIDATCSNEGKICEECGNDATNGNNKINFCYSKVLCSPCGEAFLENEKQDILKMLREEGGIQ